MRVLDGLSADMDDILKENGRKQARDWMEYLLWQIEDRPAMVRTSEKKAVIVADLEPEDERLKEMVDRFLEVFPYPCDVINIRDFPFQGGCLAGLQAGRS